MSTNCNQSPQLEKKIKQYFVPFSTQIEQFITACLAFFLISLLFAQAFISINEEYHAYLNKAIRYEGVFQQEDLVEIRATLQRQ